MARRKERGSLVRHAQARPPRTEEARFFHEVQGELLRYAAHLVGGDEAEDVVSDAFVKFFAQRERQLSAGARQPYDDAHDLPLGRDARLRLLRMVRDAAIDRRRVMERHERMLQLVSASRLAERQWTKTSLRVSDGDLRRTMLEVLATLPPFLREPWLLARENDLDVHELAALLRIPVARCRAYLVRANERMERRLTEIGLTPRTLRDKEVE